MTRQRGSVQRRRTAWHRKHDDVTEFSRCEGWHRVVDSLPDWSCDLEFDFRQDESNDKKPRVGQEGGGER